MSVLFFTKDLVFSSRLSGHAQALGIGLSVLSEADQLVANASGDQVQLVESLRSSSTRMSICAPLVDILGRGHTAQQGRRLKDLLYAKRILRSPGLPQNDTA